LQLRLLSPRPPRFRNVIIYPSIYSANTRQKIICCIYRVITNAVPVHSGRTVTRFGRAVDWSFLISAAVTLQDSSDNERKFFKDIKYCNPSFVIREFETFRDTNAVNPGGKKGKKKQTSVHRNLTKCQNEIHHTLPKQPTKS